MNGLYMIFLFIPFHKEQWQNPQNNKSKVSHAHSEAVRNEMIFFFLFFQNQCLWGKRVAYHMRPETIRSTRKRYNSRYTSHSVSHCFSHYYEYSLHYTAQHKNEGRCNDRSIWSRVSHLTNASHSITFWSIPSTSTSTPPHHPVAHSSSLFLT